MKRRMAAGFVVTALLGFSAMAASNPPFVGKWAFEGSRACQPGAGDTDLELTVTAKTLDYYASSCTILSARPLSRSGDNAYRLKLRCVGEGVTKNSELILAVLDKTEHRADLLVHIEPADWAVTSYQRCPD